MGVRFGMGMRFGMVSDRIVGCGSEIGMGVRFVAVERGGVSLEPPLILVVVVDVVVFFFFGVGVDIGCSVCLGFFFW